MCKKGNKVSRLKQAHGDFSMVLSSGSLVSVTALV